MKFVLFVYVLLAGATEPPKPYEWPVRFETVEQCQLAAGHATARLRLIHGPHVRIATLCRRTEDEGIPI